MWAAPMPGNILCRLWERGLEVEAAEDPLIHAGPSVLLLKQHSHLPPLLWPDAVPHGPCAASAHDTTCSCSSVGC